MKFLQWPVVAGSLVVSGSVVLPMAAHAAPPPQAAPAAQADPSPEGAYRLALMLPVDIDIKPDTPITAPLNIYRFCGQLEIVLKSEKVVKGAAVDSGKYTITIRDGAKILTTYHMTHATSDAAGSHADFAFAKSEQALAHIHLEDYARDRRGPFENTIFYLLYWPELKGGKPLKSGDYAGTVTLGTSCMALIKK